MVIVDWGKHGYRFLMGSSWGGLVTGMIMNIAENYKLFQDTLAPIGFVGLPGLIAFIILGSLFFGVFYLIIGAVLEHSKLFKLINSRSNNENNTEITQIKDDVVEMKDSIAAIKKKLGIEK